MIDTKLQVKFCSYCGTYQEREGKFCFACGSLIKYNKDIEHEKNTEIEKQHAPDNIVLNKMEIADNIAIGANSVVNKSFIEEGITIGGIPAKKISDKGSQGLIIDGAELAKKL